MAAQFSISVLISAIDKITSPLAHIGEKVARFGREATRGIGDLGNKLVSAKSLIIGAAAALGAEKAWEGRPKKGHGRLRDELLLQAGGCGGLPDVRVGR